MDTQQLVIKELKKELQDQKEQLDSYEKLCSTLISRNIKLRKRNAQLLGQNFIYEEKYTSSSSGEDTDG